MRPSHTDQSQGPTFLMKTERQNDKEFEECQETINTMLCRRRKKVEIMDRCIFDDKFGETVEKNNPIFSKYIFFILYENLIVK